MGIKLEIAKEMAVGCRKFLHRRGVKTENKKWLSSLCSGAVYTASEKEMSKKDMIDLVNYIYNEIDRIEGEYNRYK